MGYVIQVGQHQPEEVIIATPDKDRKPVEDTIIKTHKTVGSVLMINRARVWARRVMPGGKEAQNKDGGVDVLEVNDVRYKGDLEFLKWGDNKPGAQAIEIRHLPTSRSLDFDYQRTVQKLEITVEQGLDQISLTPGENKFDENTQGLLIQFLKVYPQNRDSKSKNPDPSIKGNMYHEVGEADADKSFSRSKEASLITGIFVTNLSSKPRSLKNLYEIFVGYGVDFGNVNHLSNDTDIYTALLKFSENAGDFGSYINRFKEEVNDLFELSKSYKALDLTKDGYIALTVENKKELVFENAKGKGDAMIEWVLENFADEYVYNQIAYMRALVKKLK